MTPREKLAYAFSSKRVRECVNSLLSGKDDWSFPHWGEAHRTKPYPIGFYPDDKNLYWAIGWGVHTQMFLWERWLVQRVAQQAERK